MLPLALALALAAHATPALDAAADEPIDEPEAGEEEPAPRLELKVWGGQAWTSGGGDTSAVYAGEATWRFDRLDLGVFGGGYQLRDESLTHRSTTLFSPLYLVRLGQRFETRNGLTASFTLGAGALKADTWHSWFQVALGLRAGFGPAFIAGELSFESEAYLRLCIGIGVSIL